MIELLKTALKLLVTGGLVYYLFRHLDMASLGAAFASVTTSLYLLAIGCFVLSNFLGAVQWYLLLRAQNLTVSFRQALIFYHVGVFFNNVLPGNIGGDALRIYDIRRLTGESSGGIAATVMDRFIGLFSTTTLALLAFPLIVDIDRMKGWFDDPSATHLAQLWVPVLGIVWLGLVGLLSVGLSRRLGQLVDATVLRLVPARLRELVNHLHYTIGVYRQKLPLLFGIWIISLGVQFSRILVYYVPGLALGIQVGLLYFVCYQPVAAILAALPISIGGLGVREGVLVTLFGDLGVGREIATAMSLLGFTAGIVASLIGGITFVIRRVDRGQAD